MNRDESPGDEPIRLVLGADSSYVLPLAVTVRSALEVTKRPLEILVLAGGLTAQDRQRLLESWPAARLQVHWLAVQDQLDELPVWGRMKRVTYFRLLMSSTVPQHWTRAIWLDCDVVLCKDLADLWDLDISALPVLAARDLVVPC